CRLAAYMHHAIQDKKESIWIAQREGRAKNSDDHTQESLLKMLALGGRGDALSNLRSLHLVPVAISYEYDPCDYLKAKEMQQKRDDAAYCKQPSDDLANMVTGITGQKGHIHFEASAPIDDLLAKIPADTPHSELFFVVGGIIDRAIHSHYRLYPGNYIAYDKLWGGGAMARYYTTEEQSAFESYIQSRLDKIELVQKDEPFLRERLFEMYANPVRNQLDAASFPQE
ncbi:MAG: acyltransferase, partial [Porphyromonadaceae bacterium]|nr:acyltransferase [Porphyromonadaceae bacterium]